MSKLTAALAALRASLRPTTKAEAVAAVAARTPGLSAPALHQQAAVLSDAGTHYYRERHEVRRASGALCTAQTRHGAVCTATALPIGPGMRASACRHHASPQELQAWTAWRSQGQLVGA